MTTIISTTSRNAGANAIAALADAGAAAGTVKVYTGTQPADPQTAPSGTLLCTFTLNDPAYGAAATGVCTLDVAPAISATAVADGTAGWFRLADSDGNAVLDGEVATSGAQINLNILAILTGDVVQITSGTITMPSGG